MRKIFILISLVHFSCLSRYNSFEEMKLFYHSNKQDVLNIIELFVVQDKLFSLRRYASEFPFNIIPKSDHWLVYNIVTDSGKSSLTILVDKKYIENESQFWEENDYDISSTNSNMNLIRFLDSNSITLNTFKQLKDFLSKNRFLMITKDIDFDLILIKVNHVEGYLYNPKDGFPKYPEASEIREIENHIFYIKLRP